MAVFALGLRRAVLISQTLGLASVRWRRSQIPGNWESFAQQALYDPRNLGPSESVITRCRPFWKS